MTNTKTHFWAKTTADGKPGVSVCQHMLNVGFVARCIAETMPGLLDRFHLKSSEIGAMAALHDIGKISPGFQRKCKAWLEENDLVDLDAKWRWDAEMESDHGKVSHFAIQQILNEQKVSRKIGKYISAALGGHHGRLNPPDERGYRPPKAVSESITGIDWEMERRQCMETVLQIFEADVPRFVLGEKNPALWWFAGMTSVADWIGSDETLFSTERQSSESSNVAEAALEKIGFARPKIKKGLRFEELFGFPPNEMQIKTIASVAGPGVYVIEAPMGMGKTEAALGAAYQLLASGKANGIYFALPTQATSNRIYFRMNAFVQKIAEEAKSSRLIHGNSWLMANSIGLSPSATERSDKTEDARTGRDWFASSKRSLISPFGVGTVDQALLAVVAAKHFFVRHFALAGKVVILDEVHSYDLYTGTLIDKLISTLEGLGCTVIVLSATLTGERRSQISSLGSDDSSEPDDLPYPLITGRSEGVSITPATAMPPDPRNVKVQFSSAASAQDEAILLAKHGGTVLWICDTVDNAQQQYFALAELKNRDFKTGLLHSRFPFWRREELETEWMGLLDKSGKTRCGSILVSTQIVEQSVDLDADLMVTELAPTDMLLQRLGRLWRHNRSNRPIDSSKLIIIDESKTLEDFRNMDAAADIKRDLGKKQYVYEPYILLRTLEVWKKHTHISIPSQIRPLIETTYQKQNSEPEAWTNLHDQMRNSDEAREMKAMQNTNLWTVALKDEEGIQTRLNEMPTVPVILCRALDHSEVTFIDDTKESIAGDAFRLSTAQAIHRNLVKVPRYCFDGKIAECTVFSRYLHGLQTVGIVMENGAIKTSGLKEGIRLVYNDELGLVIDKLSAKEDIDECSL